MSQPADTTFFVLPMSSQQPSTNTSLLSYLHQAVSSRLRRSQSTSDMRRMKRSEEITVDSAESRPGSAHTLPATPVSEWQEDTQALTGPSATGTGIDWFTTETGLMLCGRAYTQASRNQEVVNPDALRDVYVDGLTYLLRALPSDLTPNQLARINTVLPDMLRSNTNGQRNGWAASNSRRNANLLSRGITFVMVQTAIFLSLILPVLMGLLNYCLRYERQHRLVENAFQRSLQGVEALGGRGLDLKDNLLRFSEGRVGGAVFRGLTWVAEGIVQGVSEGAGKSVVVVGSAVASNSRSP